MRWFIDKEFGILTSCRNLVVVVGMSWVYNNLWAWRFPNPWDFMDAKNLVQKLDSPPLGVGHCNFSIPPH
jgi:hypothetical protein